MCGTQPDGNLNRHGAGVQTLTDFAEDRFEVGPLAIEFVDERDAGDFIFVGLPPNGFALGFDPFASLNTITAPSSTRKLRSTSAVKSTWPGVSMRLICTSFQGNATQAE